MRISALFGALFACIVGSSVAAGQIGYVCDVTDKGDGFIASPYAFVFDLEKNEVVINDPIIFHVNKRPMAGKLKVRGNGTYRVRWTVKNIPSLQHTSSASYNAVFNPKDQTVVISGKIRGAANVLKGVGSCKPLT